MTVVTTSAVVVESEPKDGTYMGHLGWEHGSQHLRTKYDVNLVRYLLIKLIRSNKVMK